jgi:hypothetical protein
VSFGFIIASAVATAVGRCDQQFHECEDELGLLVGRHQAGGPLQQREIQLNRSW